jgi:formate dehydrogenase iron-sulfur subunit
MSADAAVRTPLDDYLDQQRTLTAVERFTQHHATDAGPAAAPWRDLVPLSAPRPGEQYGFEVDLDRCTGCKACVSACHHLNGLADDESWRRVGELVGVTTPYRQTVTAACHHCVDPACLAGCPVDAYEKDPLTGIVRHLDDQCIGCRYCTLTCPYEVPRFDQARGIVRKCDLCQDRLAEGEAPACVQACPTEAIRVTVVDLADLRAGAQIPGAVLVPAAPPSALTVPTTRYRSAAPVPPDARPADHLAVDLAHDHVPLAVMLVLTQLSVGAYALELVRGGLDHRAGNHGGGAVVALLLGLLALAASLGHLGRPWLAWRAILAVRRSWLSREIAAFSTYAGLAVGAFAADGLGAPDALSTGLAGGAAAAGVVGVACSAALYAVTGRRWWRASWTAARFALTTALCGGATVVAVSLVSGLSSTTGAAPLRDRPALVAATVLVPLLAGTRLAVDAAVLRHRADAELTDLRRTALLLTGPLRRHSGWRIGLLVAGGVGAPAAAALALAGGDPAEGIAALAWALGALALVAGELIERRLFFLAVAVPRLPGTLR